MCPPCPRKLVVFYSLLAASSFPCVVDEHDKLIALRQLLLTDRYEKTMDVFAQRAKSDAAAVLGLVHYHLVTGHWTLVKKALSHALNSEHDGQAELAIREFEAAVRMNPERIDCQLILAKPLTDVGKTERARRVLTEASRRDPDNLELDRLWRDLDP